MFKSGRMRMLSRCICATLFFIPIFYTASQAQDYSHCSQIIESGLREYNVQLNSRAFADAMHDQYCEGKDVKGGFASGGSAKIPIKGIPSEFGGHLSGNAEKITTFCKDYSRSTVESNSQLDYAERISQRALESFDLCVSLAASGTKISHNFISRNQLRVFMQARNDGPLEVRRLQIRNMQCTGTLDDNDINWNTERKKLIQNTTVIFCEREPSDIPGRVGSREYPEATLSADIRGQAYDLVWPSTTVDYVSSEEMASRIEAQSIRLLAAEAKLQALSPISSTFTCKANLPGSLSYKFSEGECGIQESDIDMTHFIYVPILTRSLICGGFDNYTISANPKQRTISFSRPHIPTCEPNPVEVTYVAVRKAP